MGEIELSHVSASSVWLDIPLPKHQVLQVDGYAASSRCGLPNNRGADYVLSIKDNQAFLAYSMQDYFTAFQANPDKTPHMEKDHGRLEVRRCYAFDQLECLHAPERWGDLRSFAVIASECTVKGKTTLEHRFYISSLPADGLND